MALISKKAIQGLGVLSNLMRNPQSRNMLLSGASYAGRQLGEYLNTPRSFPSTGRIPGGIKLSSQPPLRKKKKARQGRANLLNSGRTYMSTAVNKVSRPHTFHPRMTFTFIASPTCTAGGNVTETFWVGNANTALTYSMKAVSAQYGNIAAIYNWQTIHCVTVTFQPAVAYTAAGQVALAIYQDPTVGPALTNLQNVMEKESAVMTDIKEACSLRWVPSDEQQREAKQVASATGLSGAILRDYAPAIIGIFVTSNLVSVPIGNVIVEIDLTFSGLG